MGLTTLRRRRPHPQHMVQEMEVLQEEEVLLVITTITIYIIINTTIPLHLSQVTKEGKYNSGVILSKKEYTRMIE